jgi:aryl-alcohol dehydrogenase-like predicted oxidoreductase
MRVPDDHPLNVTLALRKPQTVLAALEALAGRDDPVTIDGLLELVRTEPAAKPTLIAVERLTATDTSLSADVLRAAFASRFAQVRLLACQRVREQKRDGFAEQLQTVLTTDDSWPNRRAALWALAERNDWSILAAADDPHWRVRHALIRVLTGWDRAEVLKQLDALADQSQRIQALVAYLRFTFDGTEPTDWTPFTPPDRLALCPFWDWDPAVLAVKLNAMSKAERESHIDSMPFLAGHDDERVWKPAVETIRECGELRHFQQVVDQLSDPRCGVSAAVEKLLDGVEEETKEALKVNRRREPPGAGGNPAAHAAGSPIDATAIVADPTSATSWQVIETACRIAKVPFWKVTPANPWVPQPAAHAARLAIPAPLGDSPLSVELGPEKLRVSRLGVSGHYLLPLEGFVRAAEAGVNWFFWEPNYTTLTEFSTRLSPANRRQFHLVAGTFEADGKKIRTDVERALRMLKVEQLGLFLVFWVQSWDRMTDDMRGTVERLKAEGKVRSVGLSSHNRPLLVRAMNEGWNPVMARHSTGHRGAESGVFPFVPSGTSLITFNNLCYGRLLRPVAGLTPPAPADCYRYTLSFPQVSACWSAPATVEQLEHNLAVLRDPHLPAEGREHLERFGAALYREEKAFERLVRML